jgi:hypothetical protein
MKIRWKAPPETVFRRLRRNRVLVAGHRFGKTDLALVEFCHAARRRGCQAWYVAPTSKPAKRVASSRLEQLTRPYWAAIPAVLDFVVAPPNKPRGLM